MPSRRCLDCGALAARSRCTTCEQRRQSHRNANRTHYHGTYDKDAAMVRATATVCWLCGDGPRPGDPWQADHVHPGDPTSELRPAHRSCNAARGNRA
ncbi:MAG: hypothetical protein ACKVWR_00115 [Acidimicrobiales bacterium]